MWRWFNLERECPAFRRDEMATRLSRRTGIDVAVARSIIEEHFGPLLQRSEGRPESAEVEP